MNLLSGDLVTSPHPILQTTLMNLLSGDLVPTAGEQRRSFKLRVGRYAQHFVDALSMDENPVEYLMTKYPVREGALGLQATGLGV